MTKTILRQVELKQDNKYKVCWVDNIKPRHKGCKMTLKDCEGFWDILNVFEPVKEKSEINRNWKVGGL